MLKQLAKDAWDKRQDRYADIAKCRFKAQWGCDPTNVRVMEDGVEMFSCDDICFAWRPPLKNEFEGDIPGQWMIAKRSTCQLARPGDDRYYWDNCESLVSLGQEIVYDRPSSIPANEDYFLQEAPL